MTADNRWIQDALDAWLSPEPGTGPQGDEGWRERTGYFKTAWQGSSGQPPATAPSPDAPSPDAPAADPAAAGRAALADEYEEQREKLRTAMAGFTGRLRYTFPSVPAMTITDLATAGGWIADMERQLLAAGGRALLHKADGRPELRQELDAALAELGQYKEGYRLQRGRIEQAEAGRIAEINRNRDAFIREQERERRKLAEETDAYCRALWEETRRKEEERRDREHREAIARIRGEEIIRVRIERDP
jgi:hypothetical protein